MGVCRENESLIYCLQHGDFKRLKTLVTTTIKLKWKGSRYHTNVWGDTKRDLIRLTWCKVMGHKAYTYVDEDDHSLQFRCQRCGRWIKAFYTEEQIQRYYREQKLTRIMK